MSNKKLESKEIFAVEETDLFCGEANYTYVRRYLVKAKSERGVASVMAKYCGLNFRLDGDYGDCKRYHSKSNLTVIFISLHDEEDTNEYEKLNF